MNRISPGQDFGSLLSILASVEWMTIIGGGVSAAAGSYFAYRLAALTEKNRLKRAEAQALNLAASTIFTYINSARNFKHQIFEPKKAELDDITAIVEHAHTTEDHTKYAAIVIPFRTTFQLIQPIEFQKGSASASITALKFVSGRPMILAVELEKSAAALNHTISSLNDCLKELKATGDARLTAFRVAGVCEDDGHVDERYRHHIEHLGEACDDIVQFGAMILSDIRSYSRHWSKVFGTGPQKIIRLSDEEQSRILAERTTSHKTWDDIPVVFHDLN